MYYVFANTNELLELAKQKKWEELKTEFNKTTFTIPENYRGMCLSAKEAYRKICELVAEDGAIKVDDLSERACVLFAEMSDIPALLMIEESPAKYGNMTLPAKMILAGHRHYKEIALLEFDKHKGEKSFESEVEGIKVKYQSGRLSYCENGKEHLIFRTVSY